jgi:hypothetical protein
VVGIVGYAIAVKVMRLRCSLRLRGFACWVSQRELLY